MGPSYVQLVGSRLGERRFLGKRLRWRRRRARARDNKLTHGYRGRAVARLPRLGRTIGGLGKILRWASNNRPWIMPSRSPLGSEGSRRRMSWPANVYEQTTRVNTVESHRRKAVGWYSMCQRRRLRLCFEVQDSML